MRARQTSTHPSSRATAHAGEPAAPRADSRSPAAIGRRAHRWRLSGPSGRRLTAHLHLPVEAVGHTHGAVDREALERRPEEPGDVRPFTPASAVAVAFLRSRSLECTRSPRPTLLRYTSARCDFGSASFPEPPAAPDQPHRWPRLRPPIAKSPRPFSRRSWRAPPPAVPTAGGNKAPIGHPDPIVGIARRPRRPSGWDAGTDSHQAMRHLAIRLRLTNG